MCQDFANEFKINVWLRQGGYLFLARTEEKRRALEESCKLQRECGLSHAHALAARGAEDRPRALDSTTWWPRRSTPTTASSFRGRSCGASRRPRRSSASRSATFTEVAGIDVARNDASRRCVARSRRGGTPRVTQRARSRRTRSSTRPARGRPRSRSSSASSYRTSRIATRSARPSRSSRGSSRSSPISGTACISANPRAARSSAASARQRVPRGARPEQLVRVPRPLRARARDDVPRARQGEGAPPVVGLLRHHARREPDRRRRRRRSSTSTKRRASWATAS